MSSFEEILSEYDENVRDWADTLRFLITGLVPDLKEIPDPASHLVAYGRSEHTADILFTIMPQKDYVNLGIANAVGLSDPEELLEGSGKLHRHIKISSEEDLTRAGLHALLIQAISR